jgi:hypothetical protein
MHLIFSKRFIDDARVNIRSLSSSDETEDLPMAPATFESTPALEELPLAASSAKSPVIAQTRAPLGPPGMTAHEPLVRLNPSELMSEETSRVVPEISRIQKPPSPKPSADSGNELLAPPDDQFNLEQGEVVELDVKIDPPAHAPGSQSEVCNYESLSSLKVQKCAPARSQDLRKGVREILD